MAEIIAFPMSKSDGCIRRLVSTLAPLTDEKRRELWNSRVNVTLRRLEANGVEKRDAAAEVQGLLKEVKRRLRRRERDQERAREQRAERLRIVAADQLDLFGRTSVPVSVPVVQLRDDGGGVDVA